MGLPSGDVGIVYQKDKARLETWPILALDHWIAGHVLT